MCEYSLHIVASRPARAGDKLMTTKFSRSETRGFCAIGEPNVAVCLLPGTEVAFEQETGPAGPHGASPQWETRTGTFDDSRIDWVAPPKMNSSHIGCE
jgi:hypothetical protein